MIRAIEHVISNVIFFMESMSDFHDNPAVIWWVENGHTTGYGDFVNEILIREPLPIADREVFQAVWLVSAGRRKKPISRKIPFLKRIPLVSIFWLTFALSPMALSTFMSISNVILNTLMIVPVLLVLGAFAMFAVQAVMKKPYYSRSALIGCVTYIILAILSFSTMRAWSSFCELLSGLIISTGFPILIMTIIYLVLIPVITLEVLVSISILVDLELADIHYLRFYYGS